MDGLAQLLTGGGLYAGTPEPTADFWYQPAGGMVTAAGLRIDAEGAKKISAWFRGRDILATSLAMLPLHLHEWLPEDAGAVRAKSHKLYDVLHTKPDPNSFGDSFTWRRQAMFDLIDHGWAYDWIRFTPQQWSLRRIDPKLVTPERNPRTGAMRFHVRDDVTGQTTPHTEDEVFCRQASDGKGILECARDSLGLARVTETYAGKVFGHGILAGATIETPAPMSAEQMRTLAQSFKTAIGDWHMPRVLPAGAKLSETDGLTPDKAQMLLSRKFSINDIARWLGLPPHMLGDLDRATFSNIEHQGQEFVTYSLGPWLSLWEFAINDQLILQPHRFYAEFKREALVRGDLATRWAKHVLSVNAGIETVDEVRGTEGLNKRGGKANELREPQNITGRPSAETPATRKDQPPEPAPDDEDEADGEQARAIARKPASGRRKKKPVEDESNARARAIIVESATRIVQREQAAAQKAAVKFAADAERFAHAAADFYGALKPMVEVFVLSKELASLYCDSQRDTLIAKGIAVAETWTPEYLISLALDAPKQRVA